jgi:hypothetical protein
MFSDFFQVPYLAVAIKIKKLIEWVRIAYRYYPKFFKIHFAFQKAYLGINPFRVSRMFLQREGAEDVYTYGETPVTTFHKIVGECGITQDDVFYELGCGRGLGMFWLNQYIGCKVVGIEKIPLFVRIGNQLSRKEVSFKNENILNVDFCDGTVFYFYGTGFEEEFIRRLVKKFKQLPKGIKIITVSYPLSDFKVIKEFEVVFPWGKAAIYLSQT